MKSVFLSAGHSGSDPGAVANGRKEADIARIREVLSYDPDSGEFRWKVRMSSRAPAGALSGCRKPCARYVLIRIDGRIYYAHRLAWLLTYGRWPEAGIDHINGDKIDNRIANLREANHAENAQNQGMRRDNKTGYVGVHLDPRTGKWHGRIRLNGKDIHLGYHEKIEDAAAERREAKARLHCFQPTIRDAA